jgi:hypothetical protein
MTGHISRFQRFETITYRLPGALPQAISFRAIGAFKL